MSSTDLAITHFIRYIKLGREAKLYSSVVPLLRVEQSLAIVKNPEYITHIS